MTTLQSCRRSSRSSGVLNEIDNCCALRTFWNLFPEMSEQEAADLGAKFGFNSEYGMYEHEIVKAIRSKGLELVEIKEISRRYCRLNAITLANVVKTYPNGVYVVFQPAHVFLMVDGIIFDQAEHHLGLRRHISSLWCVTNSPIRYVHPRLTPDTKLYIRVPPAYASKRNSVYNYRLTSLHRDVRRNHQAWGQSVFTEHFPISVYEVQKYFSRREIRNLLYKGVLGYA